MDAYAAAVAEALDEPDPWRGFTGFVQAVCAMQAADRGFAEVLTMTFPTSKALEERRAKAYYGFLDLIARAKATGHLCEDYTDRDMVIVFMANAGVVAPLPPLEPAPVPTALYRAMIRLTKAGLKRDMS